MDAALADAARRAGSWLACRMGCTQCCHGAFAINALDAARLRAGMDALRASDPALAAEVERRARGMDRRAWARTFPGDTETGMLGTSAEEQERFEEFANDAACPALDPATGRCDVYAWRPMTCRVFGPPVRVGDGDALGCCELCFAGRERRTRSPPARCRCRTTWRTELLDEDGRRPGETVVAFALLPRIARGRTINWGLDSSMPTRPCWVEISTRAFENNYRFLQSIAPGQR